MCKKMNKKGQALVEFVLVFPLFLIIICTIIELGSINYQKLKLEDQLETIVNMYLRDEDTTNYVKDNDLKMEVSNETNQTKIEIVKNIKIVTPVLKSIYSGKYELKTERLFYDE